MPHGAPAVNCRSCSGAARGRGLRTRRMTSVSQIWAAGDYPAVARFITSAADECVRAAGVGPGDHVLDVACGNGNAAIAAARAGGIVTGVDITPELLDAARAVAPDVEWIEGDAQDLPFDDDSFDVVLSTFGCDVRARSPARRRRDHARGRDRAAGSRSRAGRPRARSATSSAPSPSMRRRRPATRRCCGAPKRTCASCSTRFPSRATRCRSRSTSAASATNFYATNFGPLLAARAAAEDEAALLADLRALFDGFGPRLRRRIPHGGGADMISIRCPAGSRTVQRGASQTSSAWRTA